MSGVVDAVRTRRSIRKYRDEPISDDHVSVLKEAMLRAPSSRGLRPWRFVFVADRDILHALALSKPQWAAFVAGAALAVVVCADEASSDAWIEDCSIASTLLQLTAQDLGIGSCWVQIRGRQCEDGSSSEDYIRELLGLTPNLRVECVIALGYPAEEKQPLHSGKLRWDAIIDR